MGRRREETCVGLNGLRHAAVVHLTESSSRSRSSSSNSSRNGDSHGSAGGSGRREGEGGGGKDGGSGGASAATTVGAGEKKEGEDDDANCPTCRAHTLVKTHAVFKGLNTRYVLALPPSARLTWTSNIRALQLTLDPLDNGARLPVETMVNDPLVFSKCTCKDSSTCSTNKEHKGKTWCYTHETRCGGGWSWEYVSSYRERARKGKKGRESQTERERERKRISKPYAWTWYCVLCACVESCE